MTVSGEGPRPPGAPTKIGRNDPCPCGSGKKYKKCHLASDEARRAAESQPAPEHALDRRLVEELARFAARRFGVEWQGFTEDFADPDNCLELALPWAVYTYRVQGRSVVEAYLDERGARLSDEERAWLAAQQASWLSVWEIVDVEPGVSVTLRDLLSGEERLVHEASGSRNAVVRDTLLARVVDYGGAALLCGTHPVPLPPLAADGVVRSARGRLKRKRAVPVERLRDEGFGRYLIRRWDEAVADLEARAAVRPELRNTDGDPMVLTADHFRLERGARGRVEKRLRGLKGVEEDEPAVEDDDGASVFVFLAPGRGSDQERTLIGRAVVTNGKLKLETNSRERADALRARVEEACGGLLRHVGREHTGAFSPGGRVGAREAPQGPPSSEAGEMMLEFKRRHYADWPEHPLPALGGLSPREAVRTAEGRRAVDTLLKDMENSERRAAGEYAFDFGELRKALGLK